MDDVYDFGLRLKNLRDQRGLSQEEVATRIGKQRATVSGYENNISYPSAEILIKLALLYHTSTDYMLGLTHNDPISLEGLGPENAAAAKKIINKVIDTFLELQT